MWVLKDFGTIALGKYKTKFEKVSCENFLFVGNSIQSKGVKKDHVAKEVHGLSEFKIWIVFAKIQMAFYIAGILKV